MKRSLLLAGMVALALTACGKKEAPPPPAAAHAGGSEFNRMPNPAMTSGGYTVEELAERRKEAYARYKARKGADAKELH